MPIRPVPEGGDAPARGALATVERDGLAAHRRRVAAQAGEQLEGYYVATAADRFDDRTDRFGSGTTRGKRRGSGSGRVRKKAPVHYCKGCNLRYGSCLCGRDGRSSSITAHISPKIKTALATFPLKAGEIVEAVVQAALDLNLEAGEIRQMLDNLNAKGRAA